MFTLIVGANLNDLVPRDCLADVLSCIAHLPRTHVYELLLSNWNCAQHRPWPH